MTTAVRERWLGWQRGLDEPATIHIVLLIAGILLAAPVVIFFLARTGRIRPQLRVELWQRYQSWLILVPCMVVPVVLGALWTILAVSVFSLLCYREFARATGLFREKIVSLVVALGILTVMFAVLDHWYKFFVALFPLLFAVLTAAALLADRPKGYIQRVGLGTLGFALFGTGLGHLGYLANDTHYRPILLLLLFAGAISDISAYVLGKSLGRHQLAPTTSPAKTIEGAVGALVCTIALVVWLGQEVFAGTALDSWPWLIALGLIVSGVGQIGDLVFSSIKRDLDLGETSRLLPGHGGLLDRFDSLIFVSPAYFHFVHYLVGIGLDQPTRILTGG